MPVLFRSLLTLTPGPVTMNCGFQVTRVGVVVDDDLVRAGRDHRAG